MSMLCTEIFSGFESEKKNKKKKTFSIFSMFLLKTLMVGTYEKSIQNLCFGSKIRKKCIYSLIQVNLIITLSLGSMKTDRVISEPCYNEVIYNRHIAK